MDEQPFRSSGELKLRVRNKHSRFPFHERKHYFFTDETDDPSRAAFIEIDLTPVQGLIAKLEAKIAAQAPIVAAALRYKKICADVAHFRNRDEPSFDEISEALGEQNDVLIDLLVACSGLEDGDV